MKKGGLFMGHKKHNKNDYLNPERDRIEKSNRKKELENMSSVKVENAKDIQEKSGVKMKGFY
ncbi:MAG: hypothetical protein ACJAX4_000775 [Clostridium sp.]|jgi:hypothetical protein